MRIDDYLRMQSQLQEYQKDGDPFNFNDEETRAEFIRWNILALTDELHEALAEVGWKPWATNRDINVDAFLKEMVDAWHFFLNLLLAAASADEVRFTDRIVLGEFFETAYKAKHEVNIKRQLEGYDGKSGKCPTCHRDLAETNWTNHYTIHQKTYCTKECADARTV